ncbi:hypothetical protein CKM354_000732600 [Cercospora kikuchii]|uniref:Uncharacterized protein n=1 Tax=Cercospora kikuchii TaxID=84275 RepID=A0A9P3FHD7_9PEZI|nr:uncharacterized protein CKM354_000732600 [Cercospora kikuchii]GIZ44117.1 hypothetical protein CKM354_000732600 [Cercospora kikuchii]
MAPISASPPEVQRTNDAGRYVLLRIFGSLMLSLGEALQVPVLFKGFCQARRAKPPREHTYQCYALSATPGRQGLYIMRRCKGPVLW